jgi:hypothetical protein
VNAGFRADDRVLLLSTPPAAEAAVLARILSRGVLVALGAREEVDVARSHLAEFDNVMFVEGVPSKIPWRDGYFTKVVLSEAEHDLPVEAQNEVRRVMTPEGLIVSRR